MKPKLTPLKLTFLKAAAGQVSAANLKASIATPGPERHHLYRDDQGKIWQVLWGRETFMALPDDGSFADTPVEGLPLLSTIVDLGGRD